MDFQALVGQLELEAQRLNETIAVSQHRLMEIETFLKLGRKFTGQLESNTTLAELMSISEGATQRDRVLDAAEKLLADGRRRSTRELLAELNGFGIQPGGLEPSSTLSTYLSRDDRFSSDVKRGGWTLQKLDHMAQLSDITFQRATELGQTLRDAFGPLAQGLLEQQRRQTKK